MKCILLPLLSLLLLTVSCTSGPAPKDVVDKAFFDLQGYMDGEVARLTENKIPATKSITLNGKTEVQEDLLINYTNDLRLFREADINKPAWIEKYDTQEDILSGSHKVTTYTALDSSLVVQRLLIDEDQGVPLKIEIERKTGTVLSDGRHHLVYEAGKGYSVSTREENRFGKDVVAEIQVEW